MPPFGFRQLRSNLCEVIFRACKCQRHFRGLGPVTPIVISFRTSVFLAAGKLTKDKMANVIFGGGVVTKFVGPPMVPSNPPRSHGRFH
jgi:hypothetical protein